MEENPGMAHKIVLNNRNQGNLTGILDVISFDENTIVLDTDMGLLTIKGKDLHVNRLSLEKGEIDMIFGKNMIDADAINQYTGNDKFTVSLSDPTSTRQIVLNTTRDVLADKEVRQALQHATNKQAISDGIFYGLEQPADTLFAKTVPYCDIDLEPYAYDVELAQSMLDEAGWVVGTDKIREKDGQKLNIDLLYNSDSVTEKAIAEYLQSEYQKIGISLNIHGEEEQSYRDNMKAGNFDICLLYTSDAADD